MDYPACMLFRISCCFLLGTTLFLAAEEKEIEDPGLVVFRDRCMACHLQTGMGIREMNAPSIAGLPRWYVADQLRKFRRDQRGYHEEDTSGHLMQMNAVALDERSIAFVGRFIENLEANRSRNTASKKVGRDAQALYAQHCASCHGEQGEGNRSKRIPPLIHQQDWYLLKQMSNFAEGKRQHSEVTIPTLNPEALHSVIAWIAELPPPTK